MAVDKQVTIRLEARDELTPALRRAAAEADRLSGSAAKSAASLSKITVSKSTGLSGVAADAARVETRVASASTAMGRFQTLAARAATAGVGFRQVSREVDRASSSLGTGGRAMSEFAGHASRADVAMRSTARSAGGLNVAALGLGVGVASMARSFMDFDKNMAAVAANTGETGDQLQRLRDKAIELGGATQYSGAEAAAGVNELAKAGVDTESILNGGLKGALSLAASGQMDVAEAAETAASAMTQFGQSGSSVPHIADMLAKGANIAQGSVHDMGIALNQTGLVAHQTGLSMQETVGGLTAFAKAGLTGSDAGTAFKTMLLRLNPSTKEAKDAMDRLGVSAYDQQGKFVGLANVAGQLQTALKDKTDQEKQSYLMTIFGQDAIRGANVLMAQGVEGIEKYTTEVDKYGTANEMAAKLTDNLSGDIERLGGAIDSVVLNSGSGLNSALREMVQGFTGLVDMVGKVPAPLLQAAAGLVAVNTAAKYMPDLRPRFEGWRSSLAAFRLEVAAQKTGLAGMGGAARELGLSVQQIGVLSQASGAKVGTLTAAFRAAGGATGFMKGAASGLMGVLGGPWGLALAAGSAALGYFAQKHAEAAAKAQQMQQFEEALASTLNQTTGAITNATREAQAREAVNSGLIAGMQQLGYSSQTVGQALMGEGQAYEHLVGQIDAAIKAKEILRASNMASHTIDPTVGQDIENLQRLREQLVGQHDATGKAIESTKQLDGTLQGMGGAAGLTEKQTKRYTDALRQVPHNVSTNVQLRGADEAQSKAMGLFRQLTKLNGFNARAVATVATRGPMGLLGFAGANGMVLNANGATIEQYASGGIRKIRREDHVAQIAPAGAWRVWAEDETGGEAYIPLATSKRARSVRILEEVARRFGLAVTAQARGGIMAFARGAVTAPAVKAPRQSGPMGLPVVLTPVAFDTRKPIVAPLKARVTSVTIAKGVSAPFLYTPGGKWDRSRQVAPMDTGGITAILRNVLVTAKQVKEAQAEVARLGGKATAAATKALSSLMSKLRRAQESVTVAHRQVLSAQVAYEKLRKRKKPASKRELNLAKLRITDAKNKEKRRVGDVASIQRQIDAAKSGSGTRVGSGKAKMIGALARAPKAQRAMYIAAGAKYGLSPNLLAAVAERESSFNPKNVTMSRGKAYRGIMQLSQDEIKGINWKDPKQNIERGAKILAAYAKKYNDNLADILAAHNAGITALKKYGGGKKIPFKETRNYIKRISADPGVRKTGVHGGIVAAPRLAGSAGVVVDYRAASDHGRAVGLGLVAQQRRTIAATKKTVAAKMRPDDKRAAALINALSMNKRGKYHWGGGHQPGYYKNKAALAADCSGFVGWAIGRALGKDVTGKSTAMLKGQEGGFVRIDPKIAAKTAGAIMGHAGHVVMSLGDGRVIESYSEGKPVQIRKLRKSDMSLAAWHPGLGKATQATVAEITSGKKGAPVASGRGASSDVAALREAQAKLAALQAAAKVPAWFRLRQATETANRGSRQWYANLKKIKDRGFPSVALRLMEIGEEDGAVLAASLATAPTKELKSQRNAFRTTLHYQDALSEMKDDLSRMDGPPAWVTAQKDASKSSRKARGFLEAVEKITKAGFPTIAQYLLDLGVEDGYDVAMTLKDRSLKELRNFRRATVDEVNGVHDREEAAKRAAAGQAWMVTYREQGKKLSTSAAFRKNIEAIAARGYTDLALHYMELGEEQAGDDAASAAKASVTDLKKIGRQNAALEAEKNAADELLRKLQKIGDVIRADYGLTDASDPLVRFDAPRPVAGRPITQTGTWTPRNAPLMHVEHMHAESPRKAVSDMTTQLGDAVAVTGIGRL